MKTFLIAVLIGATLAILGFVALRPGQQPTYADLQRAQLAADQAQTLAPIWTIAQAIVILGGALLIIGIPTALVVAALARFRRNQRLVAPAGGIAPLLLDDSYAAAAAGALQQFHQAQIAAAAVQPVPHTFSPSQSYHYAPAPRIDYRSERTQLPDGLADLALPSLEAAIVPTVAQLLDQHQIGAGVPLLLGYDADEGKPIPGSWLDLFSVGIGGLSGSGKTWTGMFLVAQAMLHGARAAVLDPHGGDVDSFTQRAAPLSGRYICDPAQDRKTMLATVRLFADEIERRKAKGRGEPWVLIADEFSALMRGDLAEPLGLLMEAIAQEGRKLGIYGLALGQAWQVDRSGGGSMRDSLASCYIHRLRPAQARYLSGLSADSLPGDVLELQPGRAYLLTTRGELRRVAIPQMVESDVVKVAGLLSDQAPTMPRIGPRETNGKPHGNQPESNGSAPGSTIVLSAESARILALFQEGGDIPSIVKDVYGVASGRTYTERSKDVQAVIRQALVGGSL